ncbi:ESPR-type extended signal peptide-containing protein [Paraburkholderia sp. A2RO-4L]|uniref:ESPR-type extended signal peptide-containing protein n=1 Tax=Paraburkholderia sp. A2RO-4L TaxID=3028374 RepID=UPI003DA8EC64
MNKAYRSVWNDSTQTWVAAQENATGRGKRSSRKAVVALNAAVLLGMGALAASEANAGVVSDGTNAVIADSYSGCTGAPSATQTVGAGENGGGAFALGCVAVANGNNALAFGSGSTAVGSGAAAFGEYTLATGAGTTAIGAQSAAKGNYASVLGAWSTASAGNATAVGSYSTASGGNAIAIGFDAVASSANSQALGTNANTGTNSWGYNTAIGTNALTTGMNSVALGYGATTTASNGGVAMGLNSLASNSFTTALGATATAGGANSTAIGTSANASTANSVALGNGAVTGTAVTTASGTIGGTTYAYAGGTPTGVVSVGTASATRQIQNVAAGQVAATSTDAVNGSQLYATNSKVTQNTSDISNLYTQITNMSGGTSPDAVMYDSSAHSSVTLGGTGSTTPVGLHNVANGTLSASSTDAVNGSQLYATNQNVSNVTNTVNNIVNGGGIKYFHTNSTLADSTANYAGDIAIGGAATASRAGFTGQGNNIAIGSTTAAQGANAIAIGTNASTNTGSLYSSGTNSIAVGQNAYSEGGGAVAIGVGASSGTATGGDTNTIALGNKANARPAGATALGANSTVSATNGVAIGNGATASTANSMALGNGATTSAAVTTASGTIGGTTYTYAGGTPTGVVSVGTASGTRQIQNVAAGQVAATSTDAVNGSQLYAADTQITANTTSISNLQGSVTTLQGNVTTINGQITSINGQITNINGKLNDAVLYDSSAHDSVTLGGSGSTTPVALHNVANGTLSASSLDAVNGSQLYATNTNVSNLAGNVTTINGQITSINGQITNINGKLNDAVLYDSSAHNSVTLGGTGATSAVALHNVANGTLSASSLDAVNGSQLYATNTNVSNLAGDVTNLAGNVTTLAGDVTTINGQITNMQGQLADAVMYDSSSHSSVTLGGTGATSPVVLTNVANGQLNASSTDAVNGSQLYATNQSISDISGDITNMNGKLQDAVLYDSSAHDSVTLGGKGATSPVALTNVANGQLNASSTDAVNGSQLYATNTNVSNLAGDVTNLAGNVTTLAGDVTTINGQITNMQGQLADAVMYDSSSHSSVTLGGTGATSPVVLTNVANGQLNASSTDAVNGSQLYATNQSISDISGDITNMNGKLQDAVLYDSSAHDSVTLGGTGATSPVVLTNVANGQLNASSTDAVNGSQLYATNTNVSNLAGDVTNLAGNVTTLAGNVTTINGQITNMQGQLADAVMYDSSAHSSVTLGGTGATSPVVLTNVANGQLNASSTDAVNGSQLYATNQSISDISGDITNMNGKLQDAVLYDSSAHDSVTLGGTGATSPVVLTNVANGQLNASSTDAVNGSQLYATNTNVSNLAGNVTTINGQITSINGQITNINGKLNDAVLYDSSAHNSVTLGGTGATSAVALHNVANGTLSASSLDAVNGSQLYATNTNVSNLAGDVTNLAGNVTTLAGDVTTINGQITNMQGQLADAVMYDSSSHSSVTLGGTGATSPVVLTNVANGQLNASSTDAVNGSQLYATNQSISDISGDITNMNGKLQDAVLYDSSAHDSVTLGGTGATSPVVLTNVANGQLNASSTDAVNGSQLYATNTNVSNLAGDVTNLAGNVTTLAGNVTTINGQITNMQGQLADAVMYDSSSHSSVTLGGTGATSPVVLTNVANGQLNASSTDAVNGSQLYATNQSISDISGDITNMNGKLQDAVLYDSSAHDSVTLGGKGATSPVALTNVANGQLNASSTDAVNGSQLYATNTNVSNLAGDVTNLAGNVTTLAGDVTTINGQITNMQGQLADAVMYDSSSHSSVTLGGTGATSPVVLTNVANGQLNASSTDAVNGSQLYATNQSISDISGDITNMNGKLQDAVLYDSSAHDSVTLGGTGATSPVVLTNVANGQLNASSTDAVNGSQLYATNTNVSNLAGDVTNLAGNVTTLAGNVTTINGQITNMQGQLADAVMYDSSAHDSVTLGGSGATSPVALTNVANGQLNASSTDAVNGSQLYATNTNVSNLAGDVTNLAGNVTTLAGDVTTINGQITNMQGQLADAVMYDSSSHDSVTLGGTGATSPVVLTNVANGQLNASSTDAVNGSQLYATNQSISDISGDITNMNGKLQDAVLYDSSAHDSVTLGGTGATSPVVLTNVANGQLNASSTDAVNGSQLYATNTNVSNLAGDVTNLAGNVTTINGQITNMQGQLADAVMYDSSAHDSVTLGGTGATSPVVLTNVANGQLNASSTDAVNGSQLYATNQSISDISGDITNMNGKLQDAVLYDSSAHDSVTLGGTGATSPVVLTNVANGQLNASSTDAVNGSQLYATNTNVSNLAGDVTNLAGNVTTINGQITNMQGQLADAVMYDSSSHSSVTLGGTGATSPVVLTNVANGQLNASSTDAVNGSQLYATNQSISDISGDITNMNGKLQDAVLYDSSAHDSVTLGGTGATSAVALHNVAAGEVSASSFDAVNGSQLYALGSTTADALGGGSTVNSDGSISAPTYVVGGDTYNNVGGAITNLDGRVTQNTTDISDITNNINNGTIGLVQQDPTTRNITVAKGTDGTIVDFTGTAGTRVLTGVSNGAVSASSVDAVNGSQLYALASSTADSLGGGSTVNSDGSITNPTYNIGGNTYNNAGDAFTNLDGRVTQNTTDISNITNNINNGTIGLVQQDQTTRNVTVAKGTDGTIVDFTGTAGTRVLTGVSNGAVSASSVDAVNGSQLYATNQSISNLAGDITNINGKMADAVMYDSSAHDSVTLGGTGATSAVALHNVAAGEVSASSFDAVNGSQLYALGSTTADALGGGSTVNSDGSISAPSYLIGGSTYNNVGGALTNLDGRVTQNTTDITNLTNNINNGSIGLVQQATPTSTVTVAKGTGGTTVDFTGTAGTRVLTGVSNGAVSASSTDAVNGSQLYATNQSISNLAGDITNISGQVANSVMYDSSAHDSITLGGSGSSTAVAIHNVADATANSDAVNLGQMNAALANVTNIASNASNPMFAANGNRDTEAAQASGTHATAAGANANASGNQATAIGANSTASAANSVALGAGSVADRDNTVSVGSAGSERQITNVAAGTAGTDAVNVNQLNDAINSAASNTANQVQQGVQQANAYTNQQIGIVRKEMNQMGAAAMAATSLIPNARAEGNFQMAAAAGTYGGESALALGANWYVSDRLLVNMHVTRGTGSGAKTGASVGATFGF